MNENLSTTSNEALVQNLKSLVARERRLLVEILRYLDEMDRRKYFLELGFSSLFAFCTEALGYSKSAAHRRIQAARLSRENPEILTKLEAGSLTLCAVVELAKVSAPVRAELIPQSEGKPKEVVQGLVTARLPAQAPRRETVTVRNVAVEAAPLFSQPAEESVRYTVTFEVTKEEFELLHEVKGLCGAGDRKEAVVRALRTYKKLKSPVERTKRREARKQRQQLKAQPTPTVGVTVVTRAVPIADRDSTMVADGCRCSYVSPDGHRCTATADLQLDHIQPQAYGGSHSLENLRVLCGAHNRYVFQRNV